MASVSFISGAQSAAQSGLQQLRLQQARRDADQAEAVARSLQSQAQSARQAASEAQENARTVTTQADQAQANAAQARLGLAVIKTVDQMQTRLSGVVAQVTEKLGIAEPAVPTQSPSPPVVNTQGQLTGTVVNTTA